MHYRKRAPGVFELDLGEHDNTEKIKDIIDEREGVLWRIVRKLKRREVLLQSQHDGPRELAESDMADFMSSIWEDV